MTRQHIIINTSLKSIRLKANAGVGFYGTESIYIYIYMHYGMI